MSFFITDAFADVASTTSTAPAHAAGGGFAQILMLLGFVVIFYLLLWRPQAKRAKEHRELVGNLAVGDEVVTSGGLIGKVRKLNDDFIVLEVADNVAIKVQKGSVSTVLPKGSLKPE